MPKDFIPIVLSDNKQHNFRFDFNALCTLEEELGISLAEFDKILGGPGQEGKVKMKNLRTLVWAALLAENENLTMKEAGGLIDPRKILEVSQKVAEALVLAFPEVKEDELKNGKGLKSKKNGTGKNI